MRKLTANKLVKIANFKNQDVIAYGNDDLRCYTAIETAKNFIDSSLSNGHPGDHLISEFKKCEKLPTHDYEFKCYLLENNRKIKCYFRLEN